MSRDPIHYQGGVNLYEYVQGDPVGYVDDSGLDSTATWGPLVSPGVREAAAAAGRALAGAAGATGRFIAPALTPAAAGGALVGGGLVAGGLCLWDLEGCRAAVQLYCEERGFPNPFYTEGSKEKPAREKTDRMTSQDDPLQQLEEIEKAQRDLRKGKGGRDGKDSKGKQKRIDSIKKAKNNAEKGMRDIRDRYNNKL